MSNSKERIKRTKKKKKKRREKTGCNDRVKLFPIYRMLNINKEL